MGRVLSIDYGLKRTGLAVTDPLQIIATALETVPTERLIPYLQAYFTQETVDEVVIGMPRQLNNRDSSLAPAVRIFIDKLKTHFPQMGITPWDERFTSSMARQVVIASGISKKQRRVKGHVDKISATIILQEYIEHKKRMESRED